jgi:hypothetical protein
MRVLNACNQRGGRMLSLVDLIQAGSMNAAMGAYLAVMMQQGSSLLVGAIPGGAGKTAVMVACLNFVPIDIDIKVVTEFGNKSDPNPGSQSSCYLAHEIGAGAYYAYVWGTQARIFFELQNMGHTIASNLHADTLDQLRNQLCVQNRIQPSLVDAVQLKLFLRMHRNSLGYTERWVSHIYESDGSEDILIWFGDAVNKFTKTGESHCVSEQEINHWADFLTYCQENSIQRIEHIRQNVVLNFGSHIAIDREEA